MLLPNSVHYEAIDTDHHLPDTMLKHNDRKASTPPALAMGEDMHIPNMELSVIFLCNYSHLSAKIIDSYTRNFLMVCGIKK